MDINAREGCPINIVQHRSTGVPLTLDGNISIRYITIRNIGGTMLDKIILGMISLQDMTVYELKKALDKSINHFYSTSYGGLHPALVKLEKTAMLSSREYREGGRAKKQYSITKEGREFFSRWLDSDIPVTRLKEDALVRLFFLGMVPEESRKRVIKNYLHEIDANLEALRRLRTQISEVEIPNEFQDIARFQMETLNYGIDHSGFMKRWFADLLSDRLEEESS